MDGDLGYGDSHLEPDNFYGRGSGFSDRQWRRIESQQTKAAKANDRAAARLRSLAAATSTGLPAVGHDKRTKRHFEDIMGAGAATAENLLKAAERYELGSAVLRDQETYKAYGYDASGYRGAGGAADGMMAVPQNDRTRLNVNLDHPHFRMNKKLRWALGHEPHHSDKTKLSDHGAYRFGMNGGPTDAYQRLTIDEALVNPDRLTAFAQTK